MKNTITILMIILSALHNMYGQELSKVQPAFEIFANYSNIRDFTLSANGDEMYFTIQSPLEKVSLIASSQKKNGKWEPVTLSPFSGKFKDLEPFLSPNGLHLFFASNRPTIDTSTQPKDFDIWYVQRENLQAKWSAPVNMGATINTESNEFYPSIAKNKNLYFTSDRQTDSKGKDDIFKSTWESIGYSAPISLSESINTDGYEYNAFIAPDESFLIFGGYNRVGGHGSGDLYISYQKKDNTWEVAENMGTEINSKYMDYCPFVDSQSKILYFTGRRSAVENKEFQSIKELLDEINQYENGRSRIYKVPFEARK